MVAAGWVVDVIGCRWLGCGFGAPRIDLVGRGAWVVPVTWADVSSAGAGRKCSAGGRRSFVWSGSNASGWRVNSGSIPWSGRPGCTPIPVEKWAERFFVFAYSLPSSKVVA